MLTVFEVAKFFIHLANETGSYISNLKLQKLVYYAQAWHLALHDTPLFEDDFEAWVHGSVVPSSIRNIKNFSGNLFWRKLHNLNLLKMLKPSLMK